MDLSLYRQQSAIEQWMNQSRSNGDPAFDEDSEFSDTPVPSQQFTDIGREHGDNEDVEVWAETTVGDTHLGKRKSKISTVQREGKRTRTDDEEVIGTDDSTPEPSGDDNDSGNNDGNDGGDSDGNDGAASGLQHGGAIVFTGEEDYTHATQDTDHGAPVSQRQTRSAHTRGRQALLTYDQDSSSSSTGQHYNHYNTSPPTGGFLWPPPGTMNPSVPRSVAALPYLQLHGYTPYGVPYGQGYGQPTYPYLLETSEPYEGPPGERFKD